MKLTVPLALVSLTLLPLIPGITPSANACTIVDTTTQVAIRGDRETPAQQENNVTAAADDNCFNNTLVGNTTQLGIGAGQIKQSNQGQYFVGGGDNETDVTTPTVIVTPDTQVDVYSPAHDPQFLQHLRP